MLHLSGKWQMQCLDKVEDGQSALGSTTSLDDVFNSSTSIREKNAQLNFIRALNDAEDLS